MDFYRPLKEHLGKECIPKYYELYHLNAIHQVFVNNVCNNVKKVSYTIV